MNGLHESPGLFLVCRACGGAVRGRRYCERCEEEIIALNAAARRKAVRSGKRAQLITDLPLPTREQCTAHILAILIVALCYFMSLTLQLKP